MRLATVLHQGVIRLGIEWEKNHLLDLQHAIKLCFGVDKLVPTDMKELLNQGDTGIQVSVDALAFAKKNPGEMSLIAKDEVEWQPPIPNPGKICGVAMNNSASNSRKISAPEHPAFFLKPPSCLVGHQQPIRIRSYYGSVHPEPELAVVIGKTMRDVNAVDALDYAAGYTIFNDITGNGMRAEDLFQYWAIYANKPDNSDETQRVEQHLSYAGRYKGTDTFGVMGPWLVTKDEVANPDDLKVYCAVKGETIAEDSTRYYNYKVAEVLSFISQFHTLSPGDVVSCGTAFKPSANRKSIHNANFQKVDGPVSVSIQGLGMQENPVIVEERAIGTWRLMS